MEAPARKFLAISKLDYCTECEMVSIFARYNGQWICTNCNPQEEQDNE